jgi:hypothetical protein
MENEAVKFLARLILADDEAPESLRSLAASAEAGTSEDDDLAFLTEASLYITSNEEN